MSISSSPSPEHTLALNDPGDDTARRYQFQYTWAAIVCCMLFDDTQDVIEVYCEHHEDILLKHRNGQLTGQQVKTRESDQPLWKAGDEPVVSSFARFVRLESQFPGHFRAFRFLTSHPLHASNSGQGLRYVLEQIAAHPTIADLPGGVVSWLRRIARVAGTTEVNAFQALKKATASDDLPKLRDSSMRLVDTLTASWPEAANCSYESMRRVCRALVDECARASALDHEQTLPAYVLAIDQPVAEIVARINGKRMTVDRVGIILMSMMNSTATLAGEPGSRPVPGQGSTELLLKKLDAGGFSAVSRNSAEDLRDKADYLGIVWTKQHGHTRGLEQYEHVRSLTLSDCARAFEATKSENEVFGPSMREDLRRRFKERRALGEQLFNCSDEHLEGFRYSLTSQCKVQWSTDRPWEVI